MRQLWLIDCKLLSSKYDAYIILVYGILLMWTNILMISLFFFFFIIYFQSQLYNFHSQLKICVTFKLFLKKLKNVNECPKSVD